MAKKNTINVGYQFDHATDTLKNLHSNSEKVTRYTVSDFKSRGNSWVTQAIIEKYNVPKSRIKKSFKGAKGSTVTDVRLHYSGERLTISRFKMKPKKRKTKNRPYRVNVEIVKDKPRNLPATTFVASMGKKPQAFKRLLGTRSDRLESKRKPQRYKMNQERKPLEKMELIKTMGIPSMIAGKRASTRVQEIVEENVQSRKDHHEKRFFK